MSTEGGASALFTRRLVRDGRFKEEPFVLVDVGARGGFAPQWWPFGDQIKRIGFEPDEVECERINAARESSNERVYPFALHNRAGTHAFHVTRLPNSSGFYPIDMSIVRRFPISEALAAERTIEVRTETFDAFAQAQSIPYVDFIKLDTEGSELDILEGAQQMLAESVLGISSEALFAPWHVGQRVFADLDAFMRRQGFALYDLSALKFARAALPGMTNAVNPTTAVSGYGQIVVSDVLYLRDAVGDLEAGRAAMWTETKILKMAAIYEMFSLPDCAIELLRDAHRRGLLRESAGAVESYCDLIAKGMAGTTYAEYMRRFNAARARGYINQRHRLKKRFAPVSYYGSHYWRRLVLESHPASWYYGKIAARLRRSLGLKPRTSGMG